MSYIVHYYNGTAIQHFSLVTQLTLGRHEDNDIQIDDSTLSAHHACLRLQHDACEITDLDSTNGILFNGKKVSQQLLSDGDRVTVGTHDLEYVSTLSEELERTTRIKKSWIPGVYYTEDP